MGDEEDIVELRREIGEMRTENNLQFGHGRKHFEGIEEEMKIFRAIFSSMNDGVLEGVNERAAFVDAQMKKSEFWADMRDELTRKGVLGLCFLLVAGAVFWLGFEDLAREMIGF